MQSTMIPRSSTQDRFETNRISNSSHSDTTLVWRHLNRDRRVVVAHHRHDPEYVPAVHHLLDAHRPIAVGLDVRNEPIPAFGEVTHENFLVGWDLAVPRRLFLVGFRRFRWSAHVKSILDRYAGKSAPQPSSSSSALTRSGLMALRRFRRRVSLSLACLDSRFM
jgi:hypothetical protein